jgi:hypothetical protein
MYAASSFFVSISHRKDDCFGKCQRENQRDYVVIYKQSNIRVKSDL